MIEVAPIVMLNDFNGDEFDCKCCGANNMESLFLWQLQQARTKAQVKFIINSGFRCEKYNKLVGKKTKGEHVFGQAADILIPNSHIRFKVLEAVFKVGFKRIGIGPNYIHLGTKPDYPQKVCWVYY